MNMATRTSSKRSIAKQAIIDNFIDNMFPYNYRKGKKRYWYELGTIKYDIEVYYKLKLSSYMISAIIKEMTLDGDLEFINFGLYNGINYINKEQIQIGKFISL